MIDMEERYDMKSKGEETCETRWEVRGTRRNHLIMYNGVDTTRCRDYYPQDSDRRGDQEGVCMIGRRMTVKV